MRRLHISKLFMCRLFLFFSILNLSLGYASFGQEILAPPQAWSGEPFIPTPQHPVPGKKPLFINETVNYYEHYVNGSQNGEYSRSSCPAVNMLANRGYLNRSGKNVSMTELYQAFQDVFNFGIDNVSCADKYISDCPIITIHQIVSVIWPTFAAHGRPPTINLDYFNVPYPPPSHPFPNTGLTQPQDDKVQHVINCPAAPTRNDRDIGENVNMNMTLFTSLLSFSKDTTTLTLEDLAEHHHLRHNQSKISNPRFRYGNRDAICSLAQYSNLIGILGRNGPNGLQTLFVEDVKTFYLDEDLPKQYERREMPFYSPEANAYMDRMSDHIGFRIERPFPVDDGDGRDVELVVAKYERAGMGG